MLDDRELLYSIANLYYKDSKTQNEIATALNMSRPMVSRAIAKACAIGMVSIKINPPGEHIELENKLSKLLGLKKVVVAPRVNTNLSDLENRTMDVASGAARYITSILENSMNVGVGWGVTVNEVVNKIKVQEIEFPNSLFVPLVGSAGMTESQFQVGVIVSNLANKFHSKAMFFNSPVFVNSKFKELMNSDAQFESIKHAWEALDVAIVGLGSFNNLPNFPVEHNFDDELRRLKSLGVVGDILGRFFTEDGFVDFNSDKNGYYIGIDYSDLAKAKTIVCVCSGTQKIHAIKTAARHKYFDVLVTDTATANELIMEEK